MSYERDLKIKATSQCREVIVFYDNVYDNARHLHHITVIRSKPFYQSIKTRAIKFQKPLRSIHITLSLFAGTLVNVRCISASPFI